MYMLFGTLLAMVNISACRVPLPNRNTSSISRKNPITRDSAVPAAITALAEISRAARRDSWWVAFVSVASRSGSVVASGMTRVRRVRGATSPGTGQFGLVGANARRRCRGQDSGGFRIQCGLLGLLPGDGPDAERSGAEQNQTRGQGDQPAGRPVLGHLHLDVKWLPDLAAGQGLQLGGHGDDAVGPRGHLDVLGDVRQRRDALDIDGL